VKTYILYYSDKTSETLAAYGYIKWGSTWIFDKGGGVKVRRYNVKNIEVSDEVLA
jgi:hypothetical protein